MNVLEDLYLRLEPVVKVDISGVEENSYESIARVQDTESDEQEIEPDQHSFLKEKQIEVMMDATQRLNLGNLLDEEYCCEDTIVLEETEETVIMYDEEENLDVEAIYSNMQSVIKAKHIEENKVLVMMRIKDNSDVAKDIYSVFTQSHQNVVLLTVIDKNCSEELENQVKNIRKVINRNMIIYKAKSDNPFLETYNLLKDAGYEYDYLVKLEKGLNRSNELQSSLTTLIG
ncbi:MAG: hypothetical protein WC934_12535, partial [Acidithiobacillus sp.]|uniref:hypothetical protein n=1 Tax=Acidithiobacillus sp. TaxID=1872118 RepID=UPI00356058EE